MKRKAKGGKMVKTAGRGGRQVEKARETQREKERAVVEGRTISERGLIKVSQTQPPGLVCSEAEGK